MGEDQAFPSEIICPTVSKNFIGELFCAVFERFPRSENVYAQEGVGENQASPSEIFVSQCQRVSKGNRSLQCFGKISVVKKYMDKRGGNIKILRRKLFVSVLKILVGESFCAVFEKLPGSQKVYGKKRGYQDLTSELCCLTVAKKLEREPFSDPFFSGIEQFSVSEGYVSFFCRILCLTVTKEIGRVTFLCSISENFRQRKGLWITWEDYQNFQSGTFWLKMTENSVGEPFCAEFQKNSGSENIGIRGGMGR